MRASNGCHGGVSRGKLTQAIEAFTAVGNARFPLPQGEQVVYTQRGTIRHKPEAQAKERAARGKHFPRERFGLVSIPSLATSSHGAGNGLLLPDVMRYNLPGRERDLEGVPGDT